MNRFPLLLAAAVSLVVLGGHPAAPPVERVSQEEVRRFCSACHAYPPPDVLPRSTWRKEIRLAYDFFYKRPELRVDMPPIEAVIRHYEELAPAELSPLPPETDAVDRTGFTAVECRQPELTGPPGIAHLSVLRSPAGGRSVLLACDALHDQLLELRLDLQTPVWRTLAAGLPACAHVEAADLDGDGIRDLLVACLGSFNATDDRVGRVVWLRGQKEGSYTPITLLDGVGRVADVRAADLDGDGKLDLVAAVFGWRETGNILCMLNRTVDWSRPQFARHVLDHRHGAIHVPIADLNGDGRPDFVALISQEHETVVAFLNEGLVSGRPRFRKETIYAAPQPVFGVSGIQLVDMDRDGDLDVLLANGDALDYPYLLKPYHGVQWLENQGGYPFAVHRIMDLYGAECAVAGDLDGDGDIDVAAVSFLPAQFFRDREAKRLPALVLLRQEAPRKFSRQVLERGACDHLSCSIGDLDGNGRADLAASNFSFLPTQAASVVLWMGRSEAAKK